MTLYERVERFYKIGLFSKDQVFEFVNRGKLTREEYEEITKEDGGDDGNP